MAAYKAGLVTARSAPGALGTTAALVATGTALAAGGAIAQVAVGRRSVVVDAFGRGHVVKQGILVVFADRDLMLDIGFHRRQVEHVFFTGEADGMTAGAGPAGTADAMHIVFRVVGQVVVEHV